MGLPVDHCFHKVDHLKVDHLFHKWIPDPLPEEAVYS
jgi:hypothetical protein